MKVMSEVLVCLTPSCTFLRKVFDVDFFFLGINVRSSCP